MQVDRGGPEVKWPGRGEGEVEAVGSLPLVALCVFVCLSSTLQKCLSSVFGAGSQKV